MVETAKCSLWLLLFFSEEAIVGRHEDKLQILGLRLIKQSNCLLQPAGNKNQDIKLSKNLKLLLMLLMEQQRF